MVPLRGFPFDQIRQCSLCRLREGCTAPVPGTGLVPSPLFLLGQNPGESEDQYGEPFVGQAGRLLDTLLTGIGFSREASYITNTVKCFVRGNPSLSDAGIESCAAWLDIELNLVRPKIVLLMGAPATARMLGRIGNMEHVHGRPVVRNEDWGTVTYLPTYHPAAGLHDTSQLRFIYEDFQVLKGLLNGRPAREFLPSDLFPSPDYKEISSESEMQALQRSIATEGLCAADVETVNDKLWSVQVSIEPGTGWFIGDELASRFRFPDNALVVFHHYLNDYKYIRSKRFSDTMVAAYLVGQPQGLKELASRLCGMEMQSFDDLVSQYGKERSLDYLTRAADIEWPDPAPIVETKWDNAAGKVVSREKHPWNIGRKIQNILNKCEDDETVFPYGRWTDIDAVERKVVEQSLGELVRPSISDVPRDRAIYYACRDSDATLRVYYKLMSMIQKLDLEFVLGMDLGILPMVQDMMDTGMAVDLDHLRSLSSEYTTRMAAIARQAAEKAGRPFNPSSSPQVAEVVYGELGFKPTKFTPTKEISTDDGELKKIKHPIVRDIIEYRRLAKMKGTYADSLAEWAIPDENGIYRVHTTLKTTRVETGRLSSSDPNLQNVPTRNKEGKKVKMSFVAPPGKVLADADYSQIEMVTLCHLSGCSRLVELFNRGGDPHTEMAARIFDVSLEEAKQEKYRYPVKRLNFGIAYLIGSQGLSNQIQEYIADLEMEGEKVEIEPWDEPTCARFIAEWYKLNPEVKDFQQDQAAIARQKGYVYDMFGRIRYIPEVYCPIRSIQEAGLRQAANLPVTASAQGIIKLAMVKLWKELPKTGWAERMRWLMQIHDSLILELDDDKEFLNEALPWVRRLMTGVVKLVVPVKADIKTGYRWGEMEKFKFQ